MSNGTLPPATPVAKLHRAIESACRRRAVVPTPATIQRVFAAVLRRYLRADLVEDADEAAGDALELLVSLGQVRAHGGYTETELLIHRESTGQADAYEVERYRKVLCRLSNAQIPELVGRHDLIASIAWAAAAHWPASRSVTITSLARLAGDLGELLDDGVMAVRFTTWPVITDVVTGCWEVS